MELPKNVLETVSKVKDSVVAKAQEIDVMSALRQAMQVPGAKINREKFLRKELSHRHPKVIVERAIEHNPAYARIDRYEIDKLAKHAIDYECNKATVISFGTGLPGGVVGVATMSADIVQYFVFMLRVIQELAYLYGFEEFNLDDEDDLENNFENEALNEIVVFMGVMFGVEGAGTLIKLLAQSTGKAVAKKLARQALMKTAIYPVVKKIAPWLGMQMNKQIFAKGVGKAIPVVGGVFAGGLTFATFKPCANRLKAKLRELPINDPEFYRSGEYLKEEPIIPDAEDVVFYSIDNPEDGEEADENVNDSQSTPPQYTS